MLCCYARYVLCCDVMHAVCSAVLWGRARSVQCCVSKPSLVSAAITAACYAEHTVGCHMLHRCLSHATLCHKLCWAYLSSCNCSNCPATACLCVQGSGLGCKCGESMANVKSATSESKANVRSATAEAKAHIGWCVCRSLRHWNRGQVLEPRT